MAWVYKGYCYSTLTEIGNEEMAAVPINGSSSYAFPISFFEQGASNSIVFTMQIKTFNTNSQSSGGNLTRYYKTCTTVGPMTNITGLSISDTVELTWLVIAVWVAAYFFKGWRQAARGY
jgi:hypothetical protein